MYVTLENGQKVECDDQPFAEGGEGRVYWDKAGTHVIKLYTRVEPTRESVLHEIMGKYNIVADDPVWKKMFAWPEAIIKQPSLGITMPRVNGKDLLWFLLPKPRKAYAARYGADKLGKWADYIQMAIKMSMAVQRMHQRGLCHSDLSFKNCLGDPTTQSVVVLDTDSLVVPGLIPPKVLGTPMCMAPELAAMLTGGASIEPTWQTDLHALATLIYWLLLMRHPLLGVKTHDPDANLSEALALGSKALFVEDPNDKSNHLPNLPPELAYQTLLTPGVAGLVKEAFVTGLHNPSKRPTASKWTQALRRMRDSLVPCNNPKCPQGAFVFHPHQHTAVTCPGCSQPLHSPKTLPILNFYNPVSGRSGQYQNSEGYYLVGWPDRGLFAWHGQRSDPGLENNGQESARLQYENKNGEHWFLQNLDFPEMRLIDSNQGVQEVHPGQRVEIRHENCLLFGSPNQSRMAYIQMKKNQ